MLKNSKAFTLIEIIVVLIILGVLLAISLNSYFIWIERSRASEAVLTLRQITDVMDVCIAKGNSSNACMTQMPSMSSFDTTYFKYSFTAADPVLPYFQIWAERVDSNRIRLETGTIYPSVFVSCGPPPLGMGTNTTGSYVMICRDSNGTRRITGAGMYLGMQ
jgi:prepilin-type N-terminal cleavage/methylation domain-containing protein